MQLLAEQEQVFSDKIGVFRLDPAILGSLMPIRYGFLYLFDNLFVNEFGVKKDCAYSLFVTSI
jgi:hypothetical protein